MNKQILVHITADLAELHKASPELLHVVRGCADYLDRVGSLGFEVPGHDLIAYAVGKVLKQTRAIHITVPGDFYHGFTSSNPPR